MKNYIKLIVLFTLVIIINACDLDKLTYLEENFEITVDAQPVYNIKTFKIVNAKDGSEILDNIKFQISGKNANKIYTNSGGKSLSVKNGSISIGVEKNFLVSPDNPIQLTAKIESTGYIPKEISLNFDGIGEASEIISLLNINNLPDNIDYEEKNIDLYNGEIIAETTLSFDSNNDDDIEIKIEKGIKFLDENNQVINGSNLVYQQTRYGLISEDLIDETFNVQNPPSLEKYQQTPIDLFDVSGSIAAKSTKNYDDEKFSSSYVLPLTSPSYRQVYVNGKLVSSLSKPSIVQQRIRYRNTINPQTNEQIKEGDKVFAFNKIIETVDGKIVTSIIKKELVLKKHSWGYLYVEYESDKPSGYRLIGFEIDTDHQCSEIDEINFVNNGIKTEYTFAIYHKSNPSRPIAWKNWIMLSDTTYKVDGFNLPKWFSGSVTNLFRLMGENTILKIYRWSFDDAYRWGRRKLVYNQEISSCELSGQTIDITNTDCSVERQIDFFLDCDNTSYGGFYFDIEYFEVDENGVAAGWGKPYGNISAGSLYGKTPCLQPEQSYRFTFYYGEYYKSEPLKGKQVDSLFINFDRNALCNAIKD